MPYSLRKCTTRWHDPTKEPDDHIVLELGFIAQSCVRALDTLGKGAANDAERYVRLGADFLRDHLLQWAPTMLGQVAEQADISFMSGLGYLSVGAIESCTQFTGVFSAEAFPSPH